MNAIAQENVIAALQDRSPLVAGFVRALMNDQAWASGPVEGLLHLTMVDPANGQTSHSLAVRFQSQVTSGGVDAVQIGMTIADGLAAIGQPLGLNGEAVVAAPRSIQGTLTAAGLHGNLVVGWASGLSQTVQW